MELFCTAKGLNVEVGDNIECSVFMLRDLDLELGAKIEQRRGEDKIAVWELVGLTSKILILKLAEAVPMKGPDGQINVEQADGFYADLPVEITPVRVEVVGPVLV